MKDVFIYIGIGLLSVVIIYVLWIIFIPMMIGQKIVEREIIQQSPQYVISQRSAVLKLYTDYLKSDDEVKQAIKSQMCEIAANLPASETPKEILSICH